jgi:hypothetical protein
MRAIERDKATTTILLKTYYFIIKIHIHTFTLPKKISFLFNV